MIFDVFQLMREKLNQLVFVLLHYSFTSKLKAGGDSGVQFGLRQVQTLSGPGLDSDVGLPLRRVHYLPVVLHPLTHRLHEVQEVPLRAGQRDLFDGLAPIWVDPERPGLDHLFGVYLGDRPLHFIHQRPAGSASDVLPLSGCVADIY